MAVGIGHDTVSAVIVQDRCAYDRLSGLIHNDTRNNNSLLGSCSFRLGQSIRSYQPYLYNKSSQGGKSAE